MMLLPLLPVPTNWSASAPMIREVLDVGHGLDRERGHEGLDLVRTFVSGLDHHVEQVVDAVGVVAGAADHGVGTEGATEIQVCRIAVGAGIEIVIARAADQQVVAERRRPGRCCRCRRRSGRCRCRR